MTQNNASTSTKSNDLTITPAEKRILYVLAGIQFTHIVDFMIMMPLGPMLQRELGIDTAQFGVLVSSYTFAAAIMGLLCALFVERFERKRLLLVLYVLFAAATVACALAPNYWGLLIARCLAGAFGGVMGAIVNTVVTDVVPPQRRGQAMGLVSRSFALSTVAGVPLSLFLANHTPVLTWRAPFILVAVLSLVFAYVGWRQLPKGPAPAAQDGLALKAAGQRIIDVLADPIHCASILFGSLILFSAFLVIPYITIYATRNVGIAETVLPLMYLIGGACTLWSAPKIGKYADKRGKLPVFRMFALLAIIPMLITTHLGVTPVWAYLVLSAVFFVLISGRMIPAQALMAGSAKPATRGTFMSLSASIQQAAMGLATLVAGHIISINPAGMVDHYKVVGYIAAFSALCAIGMAGWVKQRA